MPDPEEPEEPDMPEPDDPDEPDIPEPEDLGEPDDPDDPDDPEKPDEPPLLDEPEEALRPLWPLIPERLVSPASSSEADDERSVPLDALRELPPPMD